MNIDRTRKAPRRSRRRAVLAGDPTPEVEQKPTKKAAPKKAAAKKAAPKKAAAKKAAPKKTEPVVSDD